MKDLLRVWPFVFPYRWQIGSGLITFFIARFFELAAFYLVAEGIDAIDLLLRGEVPKWSLAQIALGIVGTLLGRFVFVVHARRAVRRSGIGVAYDLRQCLYRSVQLQGTAFFGRIGVGDIMSRAIGDIALVQRLISGGTVQFVIMVYAPAFALTAMMYKSPGLTLLMLPVLPLIFIYAARRARRVAQASKEVQERLAALSTHTQENLSGIRTVQAHAQEENEIKRFWSTNDAYAQAFVTQSRINSLMSAWMPYFAGLAQLAIVVYGGALVLEGQMTVGDLVFFLACLNMLLQPIRMAGNFVTLVQRAAVATRRLVEVFDAPPEIEDQPSAGVPAVIRGTFELRDLSFTYPGADRRALSGISLSIEPGESIAIVGRIGSGKSTLLKQFTRMVDTAPGQLFIDGHDIRDYPLAQLRTQIAQVLQDPFLFGEPLRENISYDDPDRALEVIWDSADAAALRPTILEFRDQMETIVGERGVTLSGGQKQRTTLARGLIRNAPVLILDDCFSSVDTETEEHILGRLKAMRGGATTILVSHRVSTLRHADRIVLLDEGRVAEVGTHDELLRAGGLYAALEAAQKTGDQRREAGGMT